MQKCLSKVLNNLNSFCAFLVKIKETLMTMVVHRLKISSLLRMEEMFPGSVVVFFPNTNPDFSALKRTQTCMEIELCSLFNFQFLYLCFLLASATTLIFSTWYNVSFAFIFQFWTFKTNCLILQIISIEIKKSLWRSRFLMKMVVVCWTNLLKIFKNQSFSTQFLLIHFNICGCFWPIHKAKTCEESTVCREILCNATEDILPSPNLWTR